MRGFLSRISLPPTGYAIYSWGRTKNAYLNSKEGHRLHADDE